MRIHVEYKDNGEIKSVAVSASVDSPEGADGMVARIPSSGHRIAELDVDDVRHERDVDGMREVMKSYRIAGHPDKPRLEPK